MILESKFEFGPPAASVATPVIDEGDTTLAARISDVYDAGSAKIVFGSAKRPLYLWWKAVWTILTGTGTFRIDLVAADDAALATNPIVLASTGDITTEEDGTALTSTSEIEDTLASPIRQTVAKQWYGLVYTPGGTTFSITPDAALVLDPQTNMTNKQELVPAT